MILSPDFIFRNFREKTNDLSAKGRAGRQRRKPVRRVEVERSDGALVPLRYFFSRFFQAAKNSSSANSTPATPQRTAFFDLSPRWRDVSFSCSHLLEIASDDELDKKKIHRSIIRLSDQQRSSGDRIGICGPWPRP